MSKRKRKRIHDDTFSLEDARRRSKKERAISRKAARCAKMRWQERD